jgi:hypothetical protein
MGAAGLGLAALLLGMAICLAAQQSPEPPVVPPSTTIGPTTRTIEGTVIDEHGRPVPGAIVLIKNMKTLGVRSYIAEKDGSYHFYGLSTDVNFQLRAEAHGMTSKSRTVDVFNSHKTVRLNLKLDKKSAPNDGGR